MVTSKIQIMRLVFSMVLVLSMAAIVGCNTTPSPQAYERQLEALLDTLLQERLNDGQVSIEHLRRGAALTADALADYPTDTVLVPRFTYEKIKFHTELEEYGEALLLIDTFRVEYPEHTLAPKMLHFKGYYIYENGLQDFDKARETYESFLAQYPSHPELAEAVLFSLEHLGQSDEEILESILEKATAREKEQGDS